MFMASAVSSTNYMGMVITMGCYFHLPFSNTWHQLCLTHCFNRFFDINNFYTAVQKRSRLLKKSCKVLRKVAAYILLIHGRIYRSFRSSALLKFYTHILNSIVIAASYYLGSKSSLRNYAFFPREKRGGRSIRHPSAPFLKLFSWAPLTHAEMSFHSLLFG